MSVLPVLGNVADMLLSLLIVLFMSMYLIADPESHRDGAIRLLPKWYRSRGREILDRCAEALRAWLKATVVSMFFVGMLTWLGLSLVGLQQALVLGVIAGVTSFIPNFGPLIALIPSIAVGLIQAPDQVGWIIVVVYGVSFIQTQIMIPLLVGGEYPSAPCAGADWSDRRRCLVRLPGHHAGGTDYRNRAGSGAGDLREGCAR